MASIILGTFRNLWQSFKKKYIKPKITTPPFGEALSSSKASSFNKVVILGIDFGTTFSKACFRYGTTLEFVKFNDKKTSSYFKESIVYFKNNKLYYYPVENSKQIKYFKYSIIGNELQSKEIELNPEILSVFFLSCLIKESKNYIENFLSKKEGIKIVNIGAPVDNFIDNKKYNQKYNIFNKIIHFAEQVSTHIEEDYSYDLDKLKEEYEIFKDDRTKNNNVLPELYAECCSYLSNPNVEDGFYAIIDIGGGTVDFGVFSKLGRDIYLRGNKVWCMGVEVIITEICTKSGLTDKGIRDYIFKLNGKLNEKAILSLEELKSKFEEIFVKMLIELYKFLDKPSKMNISVLICGGGANCKWYENIIKKIKLGNAVHLAFRELNDKNIPDNRLRISESLAQYLEYIPNKIKGWPLSQEELAILEEQRKEEIEKLHVLYGVTPYHLLAD
jgi:hypothetical protein